MPNAVVRTAQPRDHPALARMELEHFPAKPGHRHGGYVFTDNPLAEIALSGRVPDSERFLISVAELEGAVVGFAVALPFSLPGGAGLDKANMLLQFLAVDAAYRRRGLGRRLVEHLESRLLPHRQVAIVAHVPEQEREFYSRLGWLVMDAGNGFAWLPFGDMLRADFPDPAIGFEHLAAKLLRPYAVRRWFGFPFVSGAPIADACIILEALLQRRDLDMRDLDGATLQMLGFVRASRSASFPPTGRSAFHRPSD